MLSDLLNCMLLDELLVDTVCQRPECGKRLLRWDLHCLLNSAYITSSLVIVTAIMLISLQRRSDGDVFGSAIFLHEDILRGLVSYVIPEDILPCNE